MQSRTHLLILGAGSELVYLVATLRLPWWQYGSRLRSWSLLLSPVETTPSADLGPFFASFTGVSVLMVAYLAGWRAIRRGTADRSERRLVWGFSGLFAFTLMWLLPITSDLFTYLSQAHQFTDVGGNPLRDAVLLEGEVRSDSSQLADPLIAAYTTWYSRFPSIYGPAWILLSALGTMGPFDQPVGLAYLKGLCVLAFLASAWLLERILKALRPGGVQEGLFLFSWNPLLLLMAIGDGHNDVVMMAAVLLAIWLLLQRSWVMAFACLTLSVWIKYVSAALCPLFAMYFWLQCGIDGPLHEEPPSIRTGRGGIGAQAPRKLSNPAALLSMACPAALISLLVLLPFGSLAWVPNTMRRLLQPANWRSQATSMSSLALVAGLACFVPAGVWVLRWTARRIKGAAFLALNDVPRAPDASPGVGKPAQALVDACFALALLMFLFGAARSQPWHLIWPASLASLSRWTWAWPVMAALSALMLVAQLWIEWGTPGV